MTRTWSLEDILTDPPLTRDQVRELEDEDRAAGIEFVVVINSYRRARRPSPTTLYGVRLWAALQQHNAVKALRERS